ncbi:hypothetical protein Asp14428_26820 [Actinoplanes sp. NBRC 14428]|nr:hypothetical protein Asp14428_26820 [Actinoplanes sp. NBRC 14428]
MFQDAGMHLELFHQRAGEERRAAEAYRLARDVWARGRRRQGWWSRPVRRLRPGVPETTRARGYAESTANHDHCAVAQA